MLFLASAIDPATALTVGYATLALGLIAVVAVAVALIKGLLNRRAKKQAAAVEETLAEVPAEPAPQPVAPGSAGQLKLHDVEPKTAAMLMAIVAEKMGKPLNELRFISIKEVK